MKQPIAKQYTHTITKDDQVVGKIEYISGEYELDSSDPELEPHWGWSTYSDSQLGTITLLQKFIFELEQTGFTVAESDCYS
jgi:hypothetical protein